MSIFEEIKAKIRLHEYIAKFVSLKFRGNRYLALCPFHAEQTASFQVDPNKDLFHCFGCGASGDLFDFYMRIHNSDKKDALKDLASLCGIELTPAKSQKNALVLLHEFFQTFNEAESFIKQRGVSPEMAKKFGICWAPSKREILAYIKEHKLNLLEFGFNEYFWQMFERRVIFPIFDAHGKLCSFGGRALDDRAKYINGPTSKYFDKSSLLYGANFVRGFKDLYLVEGYLDVIMIYQNGGNAVASLGTSFTQAHLKAAWEMSDNLLVAMDADAGGVRSSKRISEFALSQLTPGKKISFIEFASKEDPASFLQSGGSLANLKPKKLHEYIFDSEQSMISPDDAAIFLKKLMEMAKKIEDVSLRSQYRKAWKDLWWNYGKHNKIRQDSLPGLKMDNLIILLFKYIMMYPDILEEVSEFFMRLPLSDEFTENLNNLMNNGQLDASFNEKIANIKLISDVSSQEEALSEWHLIANHIAKLLLDENKERAKALEGNFSQEEWERFKAWKKEEEDYV